MIFNVWTKSKSKKEKVRTFGMSLELYVGFFFSLFTISFFLTNNPVLLHPMIGNFIFGRGEGFQSVAGF